MIVRVGANAQEQSYRLIVADRTVVLNFRCVKPYNAVRKLSRNGLIKIYH